MPPTLDVLMPTWNNPEYLRGAMESLLTTRVAYPFRLVIINNGEPLPAELAKHATILQAPSNLGWEGGLVLGLAHSTAEFVVFANDDIHVPMASVFWARQLVASFRNPRVGAVGPTSNVVMGTQNIFIPHRTIGEMTVPFLIGFFVMLRRAAFEAIGGFDLTLPGGDDFDWSIRLRQAGYQLLVQRQCFIYHHGFKTGQRVHGSYWNSHDMTERTDNALIQKHGFRTWFETLHPPASPPALDPGDVEEAACRPWVPTGVVLELGCGDKRTVPWSVGVDRYAGGVVTDHQQTSRAEVQADVFAPLPYDRASVDGIVARHILEHAPDPVTVLHQWRSVLKPKGRLVVAVPNEALAPTMPLDLDHKHAWTPDSLVRLLAVCGFDVLHVVPDPGNGVSCVVVAEKPVPVMRNGTPVGDPVEAHGG